MRCFGASSHVARRVYSAIASALDHRLHRPTKAILFHLGMAPVEENPLGTRVRPCANASSAARAAADGDSPTRGLEPFPTTQMNPSAAFSRPRTSTCSFR
jgi:hypothetical protein